MFIRYKYFTSVIVFVSLSKGLHSPNSSQTLTSKTQNQFNLSIFFTLQVLQGPAGVKRRNGGIQPFANMKKEELINECHYRGLPAGDILKPELEKNLKEHLAGTVRVPAMVFNNQNSSLADLNLAVYEVAPSESLHDLKGHIKNLWDELPSHLTPEEKKTLLRSYRSTFNI